MQKVVKKVMFPRCFALRPAIHTLISSNLCRTAVALVFNRDIRPSIHRHLASSTTSTKLYAASKSPREIRKTLVKAVGADPADRLLSGKASLVGLMRCFQLWTISQPMLEQRMLFDYFHATVFAHIIRRSSLFWNMFRKRWGQNRQFLCFRLLCSRGCFTSCPGYAIGDYRDGICNRVTFDG
ncbi:hypothetical protein BJ741DRAFT_226312 [Chytriomyces cf. hyalinus JEL632]|nr:hypothetical protein BJ741DRAFT_226312 [Chytriomyces cf. hyalinus JEL632]